MSRSILPVLALLAGIFPAPAGQTSKESSFDCGEAKSRAERMICASPDLAALDREIKLTFETALTAVGHSGKSALRRDQVSFIAMREAAAARSAADLSTTLTMRRDFLAAVREAKGKWAGNWANAFGSMEIEIGESGGYKVRLHAADPIAGRWTCEFDDSAILTRTMMIAGAESAAEVAGGPNEAWTLALRFAGDILLVEPLRPRGSDGPMPFCGNGGNVAGNYFAQDPAMTVHSLLDQRKEQR